MGPSCPPHGTFAARAAYFGDPMCAFCNHRNPAGSRFCNDCGSPLHLKPCNQCGAINDQAATTCYSCGVACPLSFSTSESTPVSPAAQTTPGWPTGDVAVATAVKQPLFAASSLRAGWRLLRPGQFLAAVIATSLVVIAHDAYRIKAPTRDAMGVASLPIDAPENNATTPMPDVTVPVESKPVESERTAALQAPIPTTNAAAPSSASVRHRQVPAPATKRTSAQQRPVPARQAPVGASPPVAHRLAAARAGSGVAETRKAPPPDPRQLMQVSLALCSGDLIARIVCDQRVRRHFCEGHWGEAPECASGIANDHGQ